MLAVMFPDSDVCQRSLDALAAAGVNRKRLIRLLKALVASGFLSKEVGGHAVANIYRLHLPPLVRR
jgi:hypothetical protein